jgi:hypothetical protein
MKKLQQTVPKNLVYKKGQSRGFAMVLALVIMTVMFVVVGSLSNTRQMWGFFSTKQLDKSTIEFAARADSNTWVRLNRESLLRNPWSINGPIYLDAQHPPSTVVFLQQGGAQPFPALMVDEFGDPDYPTYGTNLVSLTLPFVYNPGTNSILTTRKGAFDPYWGMSGYGGSFAVMFKREMPDDVREVREGRFDAATTQLRAWMSIDAALITRVRYRTMPMSAFTYHFVSSVGTVATPVPITTNFIAPSPDSYNFDGYDVGEVGMGRIYVDGIVNFLSTPTNNRPVLGFPIVGTKGFMNLGPVTLNFPTVYGGGSLSTNLSSTTFYAHRYALYKGMLISSTEVPQMLLSQFATQTPGFGFHSRTLADGILSRYQSEGVAVYITYDTSNSNNPISFSGFTADDFDGGVSGQDTLLTQTNGGMWNIDYTNNTVTFSPPLNYFNNFTKPPSSIHFRFTGTNSNAFKLRLTVPSVGALGTTDDARRLSIITPATVVISPSGFNSDNSGLGSMIVSPRIEVDSTTTPVNIGAYVVTQGVEANITRPLFAFDPASTPAGLTHQITGGLSYTMSTGAIPSGTLPVRVQPSIGYLQGTTVPPAVPAVFDFRVAGQDIKVYSMFAVP